MRPILALLSAFVIAGCGASRPAVPAASPTPTPFLAPVPALPTSVPLSALGAAETEWNAGHLTRDGQHSGQATAYDCEANARNCRYAPVQWIDNRVDLFVLNYPGQAIPAASVKQQILGLLPSDAQPISDRVGRECEEVRYRSATLSAALASSPHIARADLLAAAVLPGAPASGQRYDAEHVRSVMLLLTDGGSPVSACAQGA